MYIDVNVYICVCVHAYMCACVCVHASEGLRWTLGVLFNLKQGISLSPQALNYRHVPPCLALMWFLRSRI